MDAATKNDAGSFEHARKTESRKLADEYLSNQGERGVLISDAIKAFDKMRMALDKRNNLRAEKGHSLIKYNPMNGQGRILLLLKKMGEMTQAEMARALEIRPQTLSTAIKKLEANGFVKRRRDALDARTQNVSITEKGEAMIGDFEEADKYSGSIFEALGNDELYQAIDIFRKLNNRIMDELQVTEALDQKLA